MRTVYDLYHLDQRDEARDIACALLAAYREICEDLGDLTAYDPRLDYDRLPYWLTRQTGAPEEWDRTGECETDDEDRGTGCCAKDGIDCPACMTGRCLECSECVHYDDSARDDDEDAVFCDEDED